MTNFQPTQGPTLGAKYASVTVPISLAAGTGTGSCRFLLTIADPPYSTGIAPITEAIQHGLIGLITEGVPAGETTALVIGRGPALLEGTVAAGDGMKATVNGAFLKAATGDRVIARALEAGDALDVVQCDFNGDTGFGIGVT